MDEQHATERRDVGYWGRQRRDHFDEAVRAVECMAQIQGFVDGWAVFRTDLSNARWYEDIAQAEEVAGDETDRGIVVRLPYFGCEEIEMDERSRQAARRLCELAVRQAVQWHEAEGEWREATRAADSAQRSAVVPA